MTPSRALLMTATAALVGCSGSSAVDATATRFTPASAAHYFSSSPLPADSLHVTIGGKLLVKTAQNVTYGAGVSNTTGTRLYYQWFTADCLSYCDSTPVGAYAEGEGMSHVVIPYANTNDEKIIVVHVTELDGAGRAGSYRVEAEGPDTFTQGGGIVDSPCDYYNDIFYPLTDTVSHRNFRRNYCGNTISYDPGPSGH